MYPVPGICSRSSSLISAATPLTLSPTASLSASITPTSSLAIAKQSRSSWKMTARRHSTISRLRSLVLPPYRKLLRQFPTRTPSRITRVSFGLRPQSSSSAAVAAPLNTVGSGFVKISRSQACHHRPTGVRCSQGMPPYSLRLPRRGLNANIGARACSKGAGLHLLHVPTHVPVLTQLISGRSHVWNCHLRAQEAAGTPPLRLHRSNILLDGLTFSKGQILLQRRGSSGRPKRTGRRIN
jgi:hypothetical protein